VYEGINAFPTIPKTIPLTKYPTTGGILMVRATNPPIKAATTSNMISLMKDICIDQESANVF
jgi:hypothetical protein